MTHKIRYVIEASVASEKLADYKKVAAELVQKIEVSEPGTLGFDLYFNGDESICYLIEEYDSSEAVFAHLQNSSDLIMPMIEMTETSRFEVYGNPSDALRQALEPFGATFIKPWQSIAR